MLINDTKGNFFKVHNTASNHSRNTWMTWLTEQELTRYHNYEILIQEGLAKYTSLKDHISAQLQHKGPLLLTLITLHMITL